MSTKKETVKVCDVCMKRAVHDGEITYGGHVFDGWFAIERHGGATNLAALKREMSWDVCGVECLKILAERMT